MKQIKVKYSNLTPLPNNFVAEQAILNILLTNPSIIKTIVSNLKISTFYFEPHRIIYETILDLYEKNSSINLTILISFLEDKNKLTLIGGIDQIITIINRFENISCLNDYIKIINEKYIRRLIIELGKQMIIWGYTTSLTLDETIGKIEQSILTLNQQNVSNKTYTVSEILNEIFNEMKFKIREEESSGLKSSFKDLDSILQGFHKSDLIVIAGRPSMGKTAFSLNLAKKIVEKYNIPLIIFSLEMSRQQILYRFISSESKINSNRLRSNKMNSDEWKTVSKCMLELSKLPIYIDDNANLSLIDIRAKLKKIFNEKNKMGLIIIDYLQLMKLNLNIENRVNEISYITRNLKILAKEFQIPIIVLSQLSRNVESRLNKRPMLSDLRESGCIIKSQIMKNFFSWNSSSLILQNTFKFEFKGIKPSFIITLVNKTKICLTSNHKILSNFGWIRISEINNFTKIYCLLNPQKNKDNYKFYKISSIKYAGLNLVFDKVIPTYHNYSIKNLILHNSIEQDADVVIMLYREDYYNDNSNNTNITEFIVAKHRNGPVGTARLFFNSSIATFENLEN